MARVTIRPSAVSRGPPANSGLGLAGVHGVVDPQRRLALGVQGLQQAHVVPRHAHGVDAGPAVGGLDLERRRRRPRAGPASVGGSCSLRTRPMALSTSRPVSLPSGPFRMSPPAGAGVVLVDPGRLQRRRVGDQGVAVGAHQQHRLVGRDGVQVAPVQEAALGPAGLDPAPAPGPARSACARRDRPSPARIASAADFEAFQVQASAPARRCRAGGRGRR